MCVLYVHTNTFVCEPVCLCVCLLNVDKLNACAKELVGACACVWACVRVCVHVCVFVFLLVCVYVCVRVLIFCVICLYLHAYACRKNTTAF